LPPAPACITSREHEYRRHGTVSLLAGIYLVTGKVHALVKDRHRAASYPIPQLLDAAYPAATAIKVILDNHSAHLKRTKPGLSSPRTLRIHLHAQARLLAQSYRRLFQSRALRAAPHSCCIKQELKDRLMAAMDEFSRYPRSRLVL
jgi:hypothetical protein